MRILIFLDTDHVSGPGRLALDFSVEARRLGHDVLMLGLVRAPEPHPTAFSQAMEAAGIPTRLLHERRRFDRGILGQFQAILDDFRPDVYQSHGYKGSVLGRLARRRGVVWQAFFHGFTWENWRVRLYHALDIHLLRGADEVVAVSRDFLLRLQKKGVEKDRLRWVPNAISEKNLRATGSGGPLRDEWFGHTHGTQVIFGAIGRFSLEKGPDHFLRAFARAAPRAPGLRAVMVGDGPMLEACRTLARQLPGGERVLFAGFRSDLASIYEALDALVIPSRSEGMPTVMIEGMLMGVPVISTRVGAVPDVVRDGETGLLVPVGDEQALAEAMVQLAIDADQRRRIGQAGQIMARNQLTVEHRARTLLVHADCLVNHKPIPEVEWNG